MHDITAIKDRLDLMEIFRRDGHEPRRMGASHFVPCPFHEEKSPSCKVEEKRFKCFGCGAGGDVFDYWEKSRGMSRRDTIDQLASLAGVSDFYTPPLARATPATPRPEETIAPLTEDERASWAECVATLAADPGEITRIAAWRGIGEDVILWALERGIIGLKLWHRQWREAFLVEMPESGPCSPLIPVATHIRLAPLTRGNDRTKASWRFDPVSRGAWPLVFGDADAKYLFLVEGQWDALALIHLMRWHIAWPASTSLVAMRGATSFRKFLSHYGINPNATAFAFADADAAGAEWFQPDGLVHQLSAKLRHVHAFWPVQKGTDLNDLIKSGFTRDEMRALLAPKLPSIRFRKPSGPTFLAWCRLRSEAPAPLGRAARMVCADPTRPKGRQRQSVWERHWRKLTDGNVITPDLAADLTAAWLTYKSECLP